LKWHNLKMDAHKEPFWKNFGFWMLPVIRLPDKQSTAGLPKVGGKWGNFSQAAATQ
jgi:hypothetical protein